MFTIVVNKPGCREPAQGTLVEPEVLVGRHRTCQLVLPEETVSNRHCRLLAMNGGTLLIDAGSTNGTYVNGERVQHPVLIAFEDEVRIGSYVLNVRSLSTQGARIGPEHRRRTGGAWGGARAEADKPRAEGESGRVRSPWEVLGIAPSTSLGEARAAYFRLIAQYHPDKVAALGPELRALAEERTREINRAWECVLEAGGPARRGAGR